MALRKKQEGFGLLEVLVSMVFLAISYTAINLMALDNAKAMQQVSARITALNIAHQVVDSLQMKGLGVLNSKDSFLRTLENRTYNVNYTISNHVLLQSGPDSGQTAINRKVLINVGWKVANESSFVRLEELLD